MVPVVQSGCNRNGAARQSRIGVVVAWQKPFQTDQKRVRFGGAAENVMQDIAITHHGFGAWYGH
jgi:hypothetical protein